MALDYLYAKPSGSAAMVANNPVLFATHLITQPAGTALGLSGGRVTGLKSGTKYLIGCGLAVTNGSGSAAGMYCRLWNSTAGAAFGPGLLDTGHVTTQAYVGNVYPNQFVTFTPGATTTIELRMISSAGISNHSYTADSWIMVVELPSDANTITGYVGSDHAFSAGNPVQIDTTYTRDGMPVLNAYGVDLLANHTYLIFATPKAIPTVNTQNITLTFTLYDRTGAAALTGSSTVVVNQGGRTTNGQLHVPLVSVFKPTVNSTVELRMSAVSAGTWNMKATDTTLTVIDLGVPQTSSDRDSWIGAPTATSSSGLPVIPVAGARAAGKLAGSSSNIVDLKPSSLYLALCRPSISFGAGTDTCTYQVRDNTTNIGNLATAANEGANRGASPTPVAVALLDIAALGAAAPDTYDNLRMKFLSQSGNPDTITASSNITIVELYGSVQREPYAHNFSPATGSALTANQTVSVDIERPFDDFYAIPIVIDAIWADYTTAVESELVYANGAFQGLYNNVNSSATPTTLGNTYAMRRTGGWRGNVTFRFVTYSVDYQNDRTLSTLVANATYTAPNNPPLDLVAPVTDTFSPATGGTLATLTTAVSFHVTDTGTAPIGRKVIWASYASGLKEVVYDGSAFTSHYDAASTVGAIDNGFAFSIVREGGWPGNFTLYLEIYDTHGNQTAPSTAAWNVSGSIVPTIASFSPALASTIDTDDTVQFDVTSPNGITLSLEEISVSYAGTSIDEAVYKGGAFCTKYDTSPNAKSNISNGHRFVLNREGGWPGSPTFRFVVTDADGNAGTPTSGSYTLSGSIAPTVSNFTPADTSTIDTDDTVQFDITSPNGITLALIEISAVYDGTSIDESVFKNSSLCTKYDTSPNAVSNITHGKRFVLRREGGWPGDIAFRFVVTDADGNVGSPTSATYTVTGSIFPQIDNITPSEVTELGVEDQVQFDVTSPLGLTLTVEEITVSFDGSSEVIYADGAFTANYSDSPNVKSNITNGHRFIVLRDGGWLSDFTLNLRFIDSDGNQSLTTSASWDLEAGASASPVIGNFSPIAGTPIASDTEIEFDVTDPGSIALIAVFVCFGTGATEIAELAYDGENLRGKYSTSPNLVTATEDGLHFNLLRAGGWPSSPRIEFRVVDADGNAGTVES